MERESNLLDRSVDARITLFRADVEADNSAMLEVIVDRRDRRVPQPGVDRPYDPGQPDRGPVTADRALALRRSRGCCGDRAALTTDVVVVRRMH
jgi:hypothetical protein